MGSQFWFYVLLSVGAIVASPQIVRAEAPQNIQVITTESVPLPPLSMAANPGKLSLAQMLALYGSPAQRTENPSDRIKVQIVLPIVPLMGDPKPAVPPAVTPVAPPADDTADEPEEPEEPAEIETEA
jgi:hypothetical protein